MREQFTAFGDWLKNKLSVIGDLIILNFLFILCCIPVFTVGAAEVACYSGIIRMLRGERVAVSPSGFFRDFAANFKKATLGWLLELLCLAIFAADAWFAVVYSEPDNTFFLVFAIIGAAVILFGSIWFYPLVARFENKLGVHIKNSFLMALAHFPKTLLVLLIKAAFIALPIFLFDIFASFGWFWLLFGLSLPLYLAAKLFKNTLQCYPKKADEDNS
jgi:uncharacterized membrane protein YesL